MSKPKQPTIEQLMATGVVCHDAYSELMPVVQELMLGRELGPDKGAVVLGMVITTFYQGKALERFIDTLAMLAVFHDEWNKTK